MRCDRTGREYSDFADGIWDDDEWISWDWINDQIDAQELRAEYPNADPRLLEIFTRLVEVAQDYWDTTGRYLQIWGELGELYAELKFGVKRHPPMTQGSDGMLGDDLVEVKTISPEKSSARVAVKRAGNFSHLLVVRISEDFAFEGKLIDRTVLGKGTGRHARYSWR